MYQTRIQYALDNFIMDQYFLPMSNFYHLKEEKDSGKSDLKLSINHENLCIYDFDNKKKCGFLRTEKTYGMQKSVDHIIFENCSDEWKLHLIEMKSSVGYKTWLESIKPKVRTSYFTALAIAEFLGIDILITNVRAYTTYEVEKFSLNETNPRAKVSHLGYAARDPKRDEWEKGKIFIHIGEEIMIPHTNIQMIKNPETGILEGSLEIQ